MCRRTTCRLRRTMGTTIRPRAFAHDMLVTSHDGDDNMALCASARQAGRVARWQRRYGLVQKHTTCQLCHTMATTARPRGKRTTCRLHDGDGNNISSEEDNEVNKYHHTLYASTPGFQPSCASTRATASNIDTTTN